MAEFFDMGGFGGFIWASYGFAAVSLGWLGVSSWLKAKSVERQLADTETNKDSV